MLGILHMRTSYSLSVTRETQKYFSTLSNELENGSISYSNNISEEKHKTNLNWFKNDKKLFERAVSVDALRKAWSMIKNKPDMMTGNTSQVTLNNLSDRWFVTTSRKLLESSFIYPDHKWVLINKPNDRKKPLIIANSKIKIIERALLNAIEPLFEGYFQWVKISKKDFDSLNAGSQDKINYRIVKISDKLVYQKKNVINPLVFSPHSYGFRPQKSAHQALKVIKHWRTNTVFFIDYDVSKTFDNNNRKRLKTLFNKRVFDARFWLEISKILNSGVILELGQLFERKGVGQGSIISPFLFNVYMHELDQKIISLQKITSELNKSYENATYGNKKVEMGYHKLSRDFITDNLKRALKKHSTKKALLDARKTTYKEPHKKYKHCESTDTNVRHIQYVRYADDFLIGIVGNRKYAIQVRKDINNFLKGSLHLKIKKDNLVHRSDNAVTFLGYTIRLSELKIKISAKPKQIRAAKKNKNNFVLKFLESDKRLARAKSYQLYSKVLSQFNMISKKLKISLKNNKHANNLSLFFAYRSIGLVIIKKLGLTDWNQFLELLTIIDSPDYLTNEPKNPAINRWISYLSNESDRLNEFNAIILRNKLSLLAKSDYSANMSKKKTDKLKKIQLKYLKEVDNIAQKSLVFEIEKKRKNVIKKFILNMKSPSTLSKEKKDLLSLARNLTMTSSEKSAPRKIFIHAPVSVTFAKLRVKGYIHPVKNKAISNSGLKFYTDTEIIYHFNYVIHSLLKWFSGTDNFSKIQGLAQLLRKSCILTLANKHNKSQNWVYTVYGNEIVMNKDKKREEVQLIDRSQIFNYPNKFNLKIDGSAINHFDLENIIG
jgi:retron-type reverse transcriptase